VSGEAVRRYGPRRESSGQMVPIAVADGTSLPKTDPGPNSRQRRRARVGWTVWRKSPSGYQSRGTRNPTPQSERAPSLEEMMEETRPYISCTGGGELRTTPAITNVIESASSILECVCSKVKRGGGGEREPAILRSLKMRWRRNKSQPIKAGVLLDHKRTKVSLNGSPIVNVEHRVQGTIKSISVFSVPLCNYRCSIAPNAGYDANTRRRRVGSEVVKT
jgi:hypothetical protein